MLCNSILDDERKIVCSSCIKGIPKYQKPHSELFDKSILNQLYILYEYDSKIRTLIHLFKYNRYLTLAKYFALETIHLYPILKKNKYCAIIPVPLHKTKYRERGYNQSYVFAQQLAPYLNAPVKNNLLVRRRYTSSQTYLNKQQRDKNVAGAFYCREDSFLDKVLLVDDVITTGSTVISCAESLRQTGANIVDVLALANPPIAEIKLNLPVD
jgi:ComF family protein